MPSQPVPQYCQILGFVLCSGGRVCSKKRHVPSESLRSLSRSMVSVLSLRPSPRGCTPDTLASSTPSPSGREGLLWGSGEGWAVGVLYGWRYETNLLRSLYTWWNTASSWGLGLQKSGILSHWMSLLCKTTSSQPFNLLLIMTAKHSHISEWEFQSKLDAHIPVMCCEYGLPTITFQNGSFNQDYMLPAL